MRLFHGKLVSVYMLTNQYTLDENGNPVDMTVYTITKNKKGCLEYLDRFLYSMNKEEFETWCEEKGVSSEGIKPWREYKNTHLVSFVEENFYITKNYYDMDSIALFLRMFSNCPPIGCYYEQQIEYDYFLDSLDDETRQQIQEEFGEEL